MTNVKPQLVLIEWVDSRQITSQWQRLNELGDGGDGGDGCGGWPRAVRCLSVGWLMVDTDEVKVLAPNLGDIEDPTDLQAMGLIPIPSRCVIRKIELWDGGWRG